MLDERKFSSYLPSERLIVGYANWNQCDDKVCARQRQYSSQIIIRSCFVGKNQAFVIDKELPFECHAETNSFLSALQIVEAVISGVNVVIWFAVNLSSDKNSGLPFIEGTASEQRF